MSFQEYNQATAIASLVCPLLRSRSPSVKYQCIAEPNDALYDDVYRLLQAHGLQNVIGQTKQDYVINSITLSESGFEAAHSFVELRSMAPKKGCWTGAGAFKETSATEGILLSDMFAGLGKEALAPGPDAIIQIDITGVWRKLVLLLEPLDSAERLAGRQARRQAMLEAIPIYKGPRGDSATIAETEKLLAELRGGQSQGGQTRPPVVCVDSVAEQIDGIIYSDRSSSEMLSALAPFIRLGDTIDVVQQCTPGVRWGNGGSPPSSIMPWMSPDCGLRFEIAEPAKEWGIVNIYRVAAINRGRRFSGLLIGKTELPSYYPYASLKDAEKGANELSDAWRRVRKSRQPIWKRLWNFVLGGNQE